jgi:hypothetical protein
MPDYSFTFQVRSITPQRATAIRDKLAQRLADTDITIINVNFARNTTTYKVIGVDTNTSEVFEDTIEATDPQDAEQQAIGTSTTKVVAVTQPTIDW